MLSSLCLGVLSAGEQAGVAINVRCDHLFHAMTTTSGVPDPHLYPYDCSGSKYIRCTLDRLLYRQSESCSQQADVLEHEL